MTYDYNSKIYLVEVVLNVKDLAGQTETAFYTQIVGLGILTKTEREVVCFRSCKQAFGPSDSDQS